MKPNNNKYENMINIPEVGDEIYTPSQFYLSHGVDDICGGKAKVSKVTEGISGGKPTIDVCVEEIPYHQWNWQFLEQKQEQLKQRHGEERAKECPDYSPESNRWD